MGDWHGNTPIGDNDGELYAASSNTTSYGPYKRVLLTARPGHPYPNRTEIMIHGGRSSQHCKRQMVASEYLMQIKKLLRIH